jgi:hypothetical protein
MDRRNGHTGNPVTKEQSDFVIRWKSADENRPQNGYHIGEETRVGTSLLPICRRCDSASDDND